MYSIDTEKQEHNLNGGCQPLVLSIKNRCHIHQRVSSVYKRKCVASIKSFLYYVHINDSYCKTFDFHIFFGSTKAISIVGLNSLPPLVQSYYLPGVESMSC